MSEVDDGESAQKDQAVLMLFLTLMILPVLSFLGNQFLLVKYQDVKE